MLAKLAAWGLTEYDRVLLLDFDLVRGFLARQVVALDLHYMRPRLHASAGLCFLLDFENRVPLPNVVSGGFLAQFLTVGPPELVLRAAPGTLPRRGRRPAEGFLVKPAEARRDRGSSATVIPAEARW